MRLCLIYITTIFLISFTVFAEDAFRVVDDEDFAPFCWFDKETNTIKGISYEIVTEAFKIMNRPLDYQVQPWGRVTNTIQNDDFRGIDATITIFTDTRKKFLVASALPLIETDYVLFTRADSKYLNEFKKVKKIEDLKKYKIVDYIGDGWAESNFKEADGYNISFLSKMTNTLQTLASADRGYDVFVQSEFITRFNLKKEKLEDQIVKIPNVSVGKESFIFLVHKKSPKLAWLNEFNKAIIQMKKSGKIQKIYDKYLK